MRGNQPFVKLPTEQVGSGTTSQLAALCVPTHPVATWALYLLIHWALNSNATSWRPLHDLLDWMRFSSSLTVVHCCVLFVALWLNVYLLLWSLIPEGRVKFLFADFLR